MHVMHTGDEEKRKQKKTTTFSNATKSMYLYKRETKREEQRQKNGRKNIVLYCIFAKLNQFFFLSKAKSSEQQQKLFCLFLFLYCEKFCFYILSFFIQDFLLFSLFSLSTNIPPIPIRLLLLQTLVCSFVVLHILMCEFLFTFPFLSNIPLFCLLFTIYSLFCVNKH